MTVAKPAAGEHPAEQRITGGDGALIGVRPQDDGGRLRAPFARQEPAFREAVTVEAP
jgi:hypothetical protein